MTELAGETKANIAEPRINVNKIAEIPNNPENNIFYNAFTSSEFQARVEAGLKRVMQHRAESGFSILSNGQKIIYTPLELGGQLPSESGAEFASITQGMHAATSVGIERIGNRDLERFLKKQHQTIAHLHFHPYYAPFSEGDIAHYDDSIANGHVFGLKSRPDLHFGIFMPKEGNNGTMSSLELFMFSGPPRENFYQAENFNRLRTPAKQREVLERSGMKVFLVELPTPNGRANLDPLKVALK